jgi:hypothetical protein
LFFKYILWTPNEREENAFSSPSRCVEEEFFFIFLYFLRVEMNLEKTLVVFSQKIKLKYK